MTPELANLLIQIPLVGIFVYFVITTQRSHSAAAEKNHAEWRVWLSNERDARQEFTEQQNRMIASSIDRMQERLNNFEVRYIEERGETLIVLRQLKEATEHLSQAITKMAK